MVPKLSESERNRQISKEARITFMLYIAYFIYWCITGYGVGAGDPANYTYVFGLPLWFFLSCVVGYVLFCAATIIIVKTCFKDFDLEDTSR
jgi:uncharacterized membrane protein YhdT